MPVVQCGPAQNCRGTTDPVANLSAEGPDVPKCFRYAFTEESNLTCEFDLSQCEAYAALGIDIGIFCNPPPSVINITNPPLPVAYSSNPQSCTVNCGDGTTETYEVVAGTFVALSQIQADQQAHQFACSLAAMLCQGPLPTIYQNTEQSCTAKCPDGTSFVFTAPSGIFSALSQAEANAGAFAFACEMASALCSGVPPVPFGDGAGEPRQQPAAPLWANSAQACSANCPGGGSYTYVVPGGIYLAESRAAANAIAHSAACQLAQLQQACLADLPPNACQDDFFAEFLSATGLAAPISYALVGGSLPAGLSLDSNGLISGVPSFGGTYNFTVRATGSNGTYAQRNYTISVVSIAPDFLPDAAADTPYAVALSVTGMASPTWGLIGSLPPGLVLNPNTGVISGTPSGSAAIYPFSVNVTDGSSVCQKSLSIEVTAGCVDWNALLWGVPTAIGLDGFNGYTFTPAPATTGADFAMTSFSNDTQNHSLDVFVDGFVDFDKPADCNCNLHIEITAWKLTQVQIVVHRMDTVTQILNTGGFGGVGVYDFPFTVPAGTFPIRVRVESSVLTFAPNTANLAMIGTVSVV